MLRFMEQVQEQLEGKENQFESNQNIQDAYLGVQSFLRGMDEQEETLQKTVLLNKINTTLNFLEQLSKSMQAANLLSLSNQIEETRRHFLESIDVANSVQEGESFLENLSKLEKEVASYYQQEKDVITRKVNEDLTLLKKRETLLQEVSKIASNLETLSVTLSPEQEETLKKLASLYVNALQIDLSSENGLQDENRLLSSFQKEGESFFAQFPLQDVKTQPYTNVVQQEKEVSFPLFAKINDQITSYQVIEENGKYYVKYQLEDGTYYFAVVEKKEVLDASYQAFGKTSTLSHEQSRKAWKENLEVIVACLGMYYQINEYMRYQEISNKGAITKELDAELAMYKKVLSFLEEGMLKQYLDYADALSKTLVGENKVENLYQEEANPLSQKEEALKNLVITILGNPNAVKEPTTKQIRESLYEVSLEDVFNKMKSNQQEEKIELPPLELSQEKEQNVAPTPTENLGQNTNYEEQETYFLEREEALTKSLPENSTLLPFTRKEEVLYKDINTYFDLRTAKEITNFLYQETNKGQGDYALLAYLKEGKIEGFTSKYQARYLASVTNRNDYFYLMLVEAMKDYATFNEQRKNKPTFGQGFEALFSFVGQNILEENFDGEKMTKQILENDTLLIAALKNFDGSYLVHEKGDSSLFEKVLEDYHIGNPMFYEKVTQALSSMHKLYKQDNYQVPTRSSLQEVAIPSGKAVA